MSNQLDPRTLHMILQMMRSGTPPLYGQPPMGQMMGQPMGPPMPMSQGVPSGPNDSDRIRQQYQRQFQNDEGAPWNPVYPNYPTPSG